MRMSVGVGGASVGCSECGALDSRAGATARSVSGLLLGATVRKSLGSLTWSRSHAESARTCHWKRVRQWHDML